MTKSDYERLRVTITYYEPDYEWLQVTTRDVTTSQTTSDYEWLQVTTSDYEPVYEWLQVTTYDCKRLPVKLRMTTTEIGNKLRHKNAYHFLWLHNNERSKYVKNCSKNSFATHLVKLIEKYSRCRRSRWQMFFKVNVIKKAFNPAILLKRDSRVFQCNLRNF